MRDVASAPVELRVEAGFKAGNALVRRGRLDREAETWWQIVDEFWCQNETRESELRGRYWLATKSSLNSGRPWSNRAIWRKPDALMPWSRRNGDYGTGLGASTQLALGEIVVPEG